MGSFPACTRRVYCGAGGRKWGRKIDPVENRFWNEPSSKKETSYFVGKDLTGLDPEEVVNAGIALVRRAADCLRV